MYFFWGPHNKDYSILGSILGPPILGNYHFYYSEGCFGHFELSGIMLDPDSCGGGGVPLIVRDFPGTYSAPPDSFGGALKCGRKINSENSMEPLLNAFYKTPLVNYRANPEPFS